MVPAPGGFSSRKFQHQRCWKSLILTGLWLFVWSACANANVAQPGPDITSSEYWSLIFQSDPKAYTDIRLAARNSKGTNFSVMPVTGQKEPLRLGKTAELWVVVGLQPYENERFPQALVARVERTRSDAGAQRDETLLFRGIWGKRYEYPGQVPEAIYQGYHDNHKIGDYVLRNNFHEWLTRGVKTDDFPFLWVYPFTRASTDSKALLRRCYLLRVDGLREGGSWIPFNIGTDGPFSKVTIDLFRLTLDRNAVPLQSTITLDYDARAVDYAVH
jgi:hypothetical protein